MTALDVSDLRVSYGSTPVVHAASFALEPGTVTTLIGPNGSGKSTLLRATSGLMRRASGTVRIDGADAAALAVGDMARRLAMLPQSPSAPEGLTVADLVARGRQPHQRWYRQWSRQDDEAVRDAMAQMDVTALARMPLEELSGGQRQRAWIALCLAQQTPLLLLDEPTTHLDISHAVGILETVVRLTRESGRTVLMVLHDLSLAARYSDRLLVMHDGRLRAHGTPRDVLDEQLMRDVFDIDARVFADPDDGTPTIAPRGAAVG